MRKESVGCRPTWPAPSVCKRSPEGLEFFGNDSAEFLTMHLDTDLIIDTYSGRQTVEWLPEASVYVRARARSTAAKPRQP